MNTVEKLALTAFPNTMERNVFLSQLDAIRKPRFRPLYWYWWSVQPSGKTTMVNALVNSMGSFERLALPEYEEVYSICGNRIIISNQKPEVTDESAMITEFKEHF